MLLLGYGMVELPRDMWRRGNFARALQVCTLTDESRPMGGFILAETLVLNGTTLNQPVLGFQVG